MRYSPVSMTENESLPYSGHPCVPQLIWLPQPGKQLKWKDWKPKRFAVAIITRSIDNEMTVCHLEKSAIYSGTE